MNRTTKKISNWDLIFYRITLRYLHFYFAVLFAQIFVIYIYKSEYLRMETHGYLAFTYLIGVILYMVGETIYKIILKRYSLSDFAYAYNESAKQFLTKYPHYNNRLKPFYIKLIIALGDFFLILNVILLLPIGNFLYRFISYEENMSIFSYLYSASIYVFFDLRILILIFLQSIQILIIVLQTYRKTTILNNLGFKEMVEEKYNSEEAKKYPPYSRFWLYAFPIAVLLLWIFIHPLSLLLIQILH